MRLGVLPFLLVTSVALMIITYIPAISMFLMGDDFSLPA